MGFSLLSIVETFCNKLATCFSIKQLANLESDTSNEEHKKLGGIIYRRFWLIIVIFSVLGLVYYSYGIYVQYKIEPNIFFFIKPKSSLDFPFPAITLCSGFLPEELQWKIHPGDVGLYHEFYKIDHRNLSVSEQNYLAVHQQTCIRYNSHIVEQLIPNRTEKKRNKIIEAC